MTAQSLFTVPFGLAAIAVLAALSAEMVRRPRAGAWITALLLAAGGVVAVAAGWTAEPDVVFGVFAVGGAGSTVPGVLFVLGAAGLVSAWSRPKDSGAEVVLAALSVLGAAVAAASRDLVALLIGIEVAAMAGYALVARGRHTSAEESAMKYFVQGAVATGLLVLGIAILVAGVGADGALESLGTALADAGSRQVAALGLVSVVAALSFKVGAAPFHSWAPDAYQAARPSSASALSGPVKLGMLASLAVFIAAVTEAGATQATPFGTIGREAYVLVGMVGVLSVVVGSTVALQSRAYTRMLGYAGVAQVGYALIAMASFSPSGALVFGVTYSIASVATFLAAEAFGRVIPEWDGSIEGLRGLAHKAPWLAAGVTVALMSLAGIPPLVGFWGKLPAFSAAVSASAGFAQGGETGLAAWFAVLAAVGIIGSIVSLGYYGSVIRAFYFEAGGEDAAEEPSAGIGPAGTTVVVLALAIVVLGLLPLILGIPATVSGFLLR